MGDEERDLCVENVADGFHHRARRPEPHQEGTAADGERQVEKKR